MAPCVLPALEEWGRTLNTGCSPQGCEENAPKLPSQALGTEAFDKDSELRVSLVRGCGVGGEREIEVFLTINLYLFASLVCCSEFRAVLVGNHSSLCQGDPSLHPGQMAICPEAGRFVALLQRPGLKALYRTFA
jgi:hypothetical protein